MLGICPIGAEDDLNVTTLHDTGAGPALLVGVSEYVPGPGERSAFGDLPGVMKDLEIMSETLQKLGWPKEKVTILPNPNRSQMQAAMDRFGSEAAKTTGTSLFYFSGHGVLHNKQNYLIPARAPVVTKPHLESYAVPAEHVIGYFTGKKGTGPCLVFIDACRDNTLPDENKSGGQDLALKRQDGLFIGYSTGEGLVSGMTDEGSYFTKALAKRLPTPGRSLDDVFIGVINDVERETAHLGEQFQPPEKLSALRVILHLVPGEKKREPPPPPAIPDELPKLAALLEKGAISSGLRVILKEGVEMSFRKHADGFWMAETECTQAQWLAINADNPSKCVGADNPVDSVSWWDASGFATELNERYESQLGDWRFALPTEEQWEQAAFAEGVPDDTQVSRMGITAWYGVERTVPVKSRAAGPHETYDLFGNVWEWCRERSSRRVARGGGWADTPENCRNYRFTQDARYRSASIGFRLVIEQAR